MQELTVHVKERSYPVSPAALEAMDWVKTGPRTYHLLHEGQAYHVELLQLQLDERLVELRLNGRRFELRLGDRYDQLIDRLGLTQADTRRLTDVPAPMPGLILDVLVQPGDTVTTGTPLLIMEAMKMENVLKADGDGVVKSIHVKKGEAVDKRQLLIEME